MRSFDVVVVHYGEVTLKRGKRGYFERTLARNLRRATGAKVQRLQGRLIIPLKDDMDLDELLRRVGKVFGVVWYAPAIKAESLEDLERKLLNLLEGLDLRSFKVETRRSDKSFPMTSLEISRTLGASLASKLELKVDLESPEKTVFIEVTEKGIYASIDKLHGPGGLPIGVSGKVLALISGGIDSPVAAWFMMRRGCVVDAMHIYNLPSIDDVMRSKIARIMEKLTEYCFELKLYLLPFSIFWERAQEIPEKMKLIMFRSYMFKLADILAEKYRYLGVVTGDNLGQVASQTLENMNAVSSFIKVPVYRPLIGFDKQESVTYAERIGTYQLSIEDYPEPCMILGKYHPETKARPEDVLRLWERYRLDEVIDETISSLEIYRFKVGESPEKID